MKRIFQTSIVVILGLVLCHSVYAKDEIQSTWAAAPCQIDGAAAEWQADPVGTHDKTKVVYSFRNDAKYMYILFKFTDQKTISSLQHTGLTVYLDNQGKKKKDYFINFAKKQVTADEYIAMMEKQRGALDDAAKQKLRENKAYIYYAADVTNKKADKNAQPSDTFGPATYRDAMAQDGYILEFAIPLERAADLDPGVGAAPGSAIKVGFEWGGWTDELKQQRMAQLVAQDTSASAGQATSSAMQEDGGSRESNPLANRLRRMAPKKYDFWVDVQLAVQQ